MKLERPCKYIHSPQCDICTTISVYVSLAPSSLVPLCLLPMRTLPRETTTPLIFYPPRVHPLPPARLERPLSLTHSMCTPPSERLPLPLSLAYPMCTPSPCSERLPLPFSLAYPVCNPLVRDYHSPCLLPIPCALSLREITTPLVSCPSRVHPLPTQ